MNWPFAKTDVACLATVTYRTSQCDEQTCFLVLKGSLSHEVNSDHRSRSHFFAWPLERKRASCARCWWDGVKVLMAKLACLDLSCLHFIPASHRYVPSFIVNDSTKVEDLCVLECDAVSGRAFRDDWKNCAGYLHIMTNYCTVLVYVITCGWLK